MRCAACKSDNVEVLRDGVHGYCYACDRRVTLLPDPPDGPQQMQIFFSYGHENHAVFVDALRERIEQKTQGRIRIWIDHDRLREGSNWRDEIARAIRRSDGLMAFLSRYTSRENSVCLDELAIAISSKHGMIRAVLLEPADSFSPPARAAEYQWADMSDYPQYLARGQAAWAQYVDEKAALVIRMLDNDEIRRYNYELQFLRGKLLPGVPNELSKFDRLVEKELVGRAWLTERVEAWLDDPEAKRILLLYGKPGAGKSMFAAHLQHYNPRVAAALACDYQSDEFSRTDSILNWLAYKLAMRIPEYRGALLALFEDDRFQPADARDRFERLILQPLSRCGSIDGEHATMVVLIDALDEARTGELMRFVSENVGQFTPWLRFLITARKEPVITECFAGYPCIDYDLSTDDNRADLLAYYCARLDRALAGRPGKAELYARLVERSEGVFAYAERVCDDLLDELAQRPETDLTDYPLPRGLHALFRSTLDRRQFVWHTQAGTLNFQGFWQRPLGMLIAAPDPLPVATLRQLMGWGVNEYMGFRAPLTTLLTETNGCLTVFHRSFAEWLDSHAAQSDGEHRGSFHTSRTDGRRALAEACYAVYQTAPDTLDDYMLMHLTQLLRSCGLDEAYRTVRNDDALMDRLSELELRLRTQSRFDLSLPLCEELVRVFDGAQDAYGRWWLVCWLQALSAETFQLGMMVQADEAATHAIAVLRTLIAEQPGKLNLKKFLAELLSTATSVRLTLGATSDALQLGEEACRLAGTMARRYYLDDECQCIYAEASMQYAMALDARGRRRDAEQALRQGLAFARAALALAPQNRKGRLTLSNVMTVLVAIRGEAGGRDELLQLQQEALEVAQTLLQADPDDALSIGLYSQAAFRLADLLEQDDPAQAAALRQQANALLQQSEAAHPQLAINKMLQIAYNTQDDAQALALARRAAEENPQISLYRKLLGQMLLESALALADAGDTAGALQHCREATEQLEGIVNNDPEDAEVRDLLVTGLLMLADRLDDAGDSAQALAQAQEALSHGSALVALQSDNDAYAGNYADALEAVADRLYNRGEAAAAMPLYARRIKIRQALAQTQEPDAQVDLMLALDDAAAALLDTEQTELAPALLQQCTALADRLMQLPQLPLQVGYRLAFAASRLAELLLLYGDQAQSLDRYDRCRALLEQLVQQAAGEEDYGDYVEALAECLDTLWEMTGLESYLQQAKQTALLAPQMLKCRRILADET